MPRLSDSAALRASMIGSIGLLLFAPLHAVAYLRDEDWDGQGAIHWTHPTFDAIPGLWDWGAPHETYLWFGRVTALMLPLMLLGALALHRRQARADRRFERWAFRAFAVGATLLSLGGLLEYYTPLTDAFFLALALPGLALTLITGTLFGIATAKADAVPTRLGVLLAIAFLPGLPILVALLGHIPIGMYLNAITWLLIGRHLRGRSRATQARVAVA